MDMGKKGFTLIEILIALAVASFVMAAAYSLYSVFYKNTHAQNLLVEAQQNARAGIEIMQREFINAGYRVPGDVEPVTIAEDHAFEFRYVDSSSGKGLTVKYAAVDESGVVYLYKTICETSATFSPIECANKENLEYLKKHKLIPNLKDTNSVTFKYYDIEGNPTSDKLKVRFVKATLTTVTQSSLPTTNAKKTVEVSMEVRLRNIGISSSATDLTAPGQPLELQVREVKIGTREGICGQLKLKWKLGPEGNLAGYRIFYTLGAATWNASASLADLGGCPGGYCTYTLVTPVKAVTDITDGDNALKCSESDGNPVNTYVFGIRAYNTQQNHSILSAEVSGAPVPSNYTFDSGEDDTTINPSKPLGVTSFKAKDGPLDNEVELSWSYDKTNNPDVVGFRIYRSTRPFEDDDFPLAAGGDIKLIAAEKAVEGAIKIGASVTSFIDKGLTGCTTYYYAIAIVNCDETLIAATDAIEVGDKTKYVPSDYTVTYGDGTDGVADSPDGSDTTPDDHGKPPQPKLLPYAGWKRVFLALTNPTLGQSADFEATPDFDYSRVYVSEGGGCPKIDAAGTITEGFPIPNSDSGVAGKFITPGTVTVSNLTHVDMCTNSTCSGTPLNGSTPHLNNNTIYCYLAVAYDKCGNNTPTEKLVTTLAQMCGDDPKGAPGDGTKGGIWPPAGSELTVYGCDEKTGMEVSWQTMDHTYPNGYFDGALYRVHMNMGDPYVFGPSYDPKTSSTLVTFGQAPNTALSTLSSGTITSGISDGQTYTFGVSATDCVYENNTKGFPNNHSGWLTKSNITPGRISRDEKQNTDRDSHREVLTGVTLSNIEPYSSPTVEASMEAGNAETSYKHHTVTVFFENTQANTGASDNNMVIQKLSLSWTNPSAFLRRVAIGDGKSGIVVTTTSLDTAATNSLTNDPYIRGVSNYDITDAIIPGGTRWVPITFEFSDGSGNPIDMRDDLLLMTLNIKNGSTKTTGCESYLTISGNAEFSGIPVPLGPTINTVSQTNPTSSGFAVPGVDGASVPIDGTYNPVRQASGSQDVTVTAYVTPQDVAVSSAKLYWIDTPLTEGSAPATPSSYHVVTMVHEANQWSGTIKIADVTATSSLPRRIWYYILAEDTDGNYDRAPEMREGFYTYDWKPFDPCDVTPMAPAFLVANDVGVGNASVQWPPVTRYTNGAAIDKDPLKYIVYRRKTATGAFTKLYEVSGSPATCSWAYAGDVDGEPDDPSGGPAVSSYYRNCKDTYGLLFWWDDVDTVANDLTYYVVAQNSCNDAADLNISGNTNYFRECQGSTSTVISANPSKIRKGQSYTVTVNDCGLAGEPSNVIKVVNTATTSTYNLPLTEDVYNTGLFTGSVSTATDITVSPTDTVSDTITIKCDIADGCSTRATTTVTVSAAPCDYSPSAPTGLAGSVPSIGANREAAVILRWTASASPDRKRYKIYRKSGAGGIWAAVAELTEDDSGQITYTDVVGKSSLTSNDYYYYVTTVDSCPLEGGASGTIGPF